MFRSAGHLGGAGARYRNMEITGRLEGASPHKLIAILFEELIRAVDAAQLAMERSDTARQADRQAKALSILQALDASLDHEKGGEVASTLSTVYRQCNRLISLGTREKNVEALDKARKLIADIASAWENIA